MKYNRLTDTTLGIALFAIIAGSSLPSRGNIAAPMTEKQVALSNEAVDVKITGTKAEVTGTFQFSVTRSWYDEADYSLYLPVYAAEGTKPAEIMPTVSADGKALIVAHAAEHPFGDIRTIKGQRPYWFATTVSAKDFKSDTSKKLVVKIGYSQSLVNGSFIYTPLIPKQNKRVDYGSISFTADGPLKLEAKDSHDFKMEGEKLVVEPHHTRAIIVKTGSKIP